MLPSNNIAVPGRWATLLCLILLSGCAGGFGHDGERARLAAEASDRATTLRAEGELFQALEHWRMVDALQPGRADVAGHMADLESEIETRVQSLSKEAARATDRGRTRTARKKLLQALSLQPTNVQLRERLERLEDRRANAKLAKGPTTSANKTSTVADAPPIDGPQREAEKLYQSALDRLASDPAAARTLFEQVLRIAPTHLGARAYLESLR